MVSCCKRAIQSGSIHDIQQRRNLNGITCLHFAILRDKDIGMYDAFARSIPLTTTRTGGHMAHTRKSWLLRQVDQAALEAGSSTISSTA